ncbi:MAG: HDOD domain-containing protein [Steroidobacteraceae bacterium]|nr:HDOD domain-containing protein [Steroidobacteraceae bacterium]
MTSTPRQPASGARRDASRSGEFKFLTELARELSTGQVDMPCFPDIVIRVQRALDDPRNTAATLVKIVSAEPRLASRLLQIANSAAYNPSGASVTEIRAAITRLGQQFIQSTVVSFAMREFTEAPKLRSYAKELKMLWRDSVTVAALCQVLAGLTKISPDEAFLTGLVHGIGSLYILTRAAHGEESFGEDVSWLSEIGSWRASIGKAVLENWGFGPGICEAVGEQSNAEYQSRGGPDLTDILICALLLAEILKTPEPWTITLGEVRSFRVIGLTAMDCSPLLLHARDKLNDLYETLGFGIKV